MTTAESFTIMKHALNAAAPDDKTWDAGYDTFKSSLADGETLEQSYLNGLDAAAPTQERWIDGYDQLVLWGALEGGAPDRTHTSRMSLKSKFKENTLAIRKLFNKDIDHDPKPGVVYFWAIVIYAFFGLLVAALLMMLLQIAMGFGWIHTANNTAVAVLLYVIGVIAGACLGFAAASKQLQHREKQRIVAPTAPTPTPETA